MPSTSQPRTKTKSMFVFNCGPRRIIKFSTKSCEQLQDSLLHGWVWNLEYILFEPSFTKKDLRKLMKQHGYDYQTNELGKTFIIDKNVLIGFIRQCGSSIRDCEEAHSGSALGGVEDALTSYTRFTPWGPDIDPDQLAGKQVGDSIDASPRLSTKKLPYNDEFVTIYGIGVVPVHTHGVISSELASFLHKPERIEMTRLEVTNEISDYINSNGLQYSSCRIIKPNDALRTLLKLDVDDHLTNHNIQRYLTQHFEWTQ